MPKINESLRRSCQEQPEDRFNVIITAVHSKDEAILAEPSLSNLQPIEGLQGLFKASLTGAEVLDISTRTDIDAIEPDEPVDLFQTPR